MSPVRVLVVDDSATMRGLISLALRRDPEIEVVATASNPLTARESIKTHNPDVITLDVEMPGMNGLEFLEKIVRLRPTPVIIWSRASPSRANSIRPSGCRAREHFSLKRTPCSVRVMKPQRCSTRFCQPKPQSRRSVSRSSPARGSGWR